VQLRHGGQQRLDHRPCRGATHRDGVTTVDHAGQHITVRADLDEPLHALAGQRRHAVVETHGLPDVPNPVLGVELGDQRTGQVRHDHQSRLVVGHGLGDLAELGQHRVHQRRVERVGNPQPLGLLELRGHREDFGLDPGQPTTEVGSLIAGDGHTPSSQGAAAPSPRWPGSHTISAALGQRSASAGHARGDQPASVHQGTVRRRHAPRPTHRSSARQRSPASGPRPPAERNSATYRPRIAPAACSPSRSRSAPPSNITSRSGRSSSVSRCAHNSPRRWASANNREGVVEALAPMPTIAANPDPENRNAVLATTRWTCHAARRGPVRTAAMAARPR